MACEHRPAVDASDRGWKRSRRRVYANGVVWVANYSDESVSKVNPSLLVQAVSYPVGIYPRAVAVADGKGLGGRERPIVIRAKNRRLALSRAEARGLMGRNPAAPELVHRPIGERASFTVIDAKLGSKILEAAAGTDPWGAAVHLALGLGLRREEVLGLRWEDVDDAVHVRRTLTAADGAFHFGPPKSAAGRRDLPMPGFVARAIHRHRLEQSERLLSLRIRPELVVCNPIGEPFQPATFSGIWKDWATAHGFAGITFHGLRHGAATLLLAAGVSDTVAMRTMGHADTRILARYQDVVSELQRDAAARMDALLGG